MASNDGWEDVPVDAAHGWEEVPVVPQPASPAPPHPPNRFWDSLGRGVYQGLTLGHGDEAAAALSATLPFLDDAAKGETWVERYRHARDDSRQRDASAREDNPKTFAGGAVAGGLFGASKLPLPTGTALGRLGSGAALGGAAALGSSNADLTKGQLGQAIGDVAGVSGLQDAGRYLSSGHPGKAALSLAGSGMAGGLLTAGLAEAAPAAVRGVVRPTEDARYLQGQGVDLTLGQLNPESAAAQMEEAGTSLPVVGRILERQRDAARDGWANAVMRQAMPPGRQPIPNGSTVDNLAHAYEGFNEAYRPLRGAPVAAHFEGVPIRQAMSEAFNAAATNPEVMAPEAERQMVGRFLQNQASTLDRVRQTPATPSPSSATELARLGTAAAESTTVPAEALLRIRSAIRGEKRNYSGSSANPAAARLLGGAEQALTRTLENQLPPSMAEALRRTDAQYGTYKTVEDAVARAKDNIHGISPHNLSMAVKGATEDGVYARGGGGELRRLAQAGHQVLDARVPPTGARIYATGAGMVTSPATALINASPAAKAFLSGTTGWQQATQRLLDGPGRFLPSSAAVGRFAPQADSVRALIEALQAKQAASPVSLDDSNPQSPSTLAALLRKQ